MDITQIKVNPNNPRTIKDDKFKKLCNSLRENPEFLNVRPIVVKDNVIYGGNMRWLALKEIGIEIKPEWIKDVTGWTDEAIRKFVVIDNLPYGDNDWDMLANEYEQEELEAWGMDVEKWPDEEVVEDEVPEVTENPKSKLGEVYQLGSHKILCGDSTDPKQVERLMDGKKADMVFTDPPYGMEFQSNFREKTPQFNKIENDDVILDISPILFSIMKDNSVAYICTRWDLYPKWYQQIESVFKIKNCVVWYKKGGGLGDLKNSYSPNHEFIVVAHKGQCELRGKRDADVWQLERDGFNSYEHPTQKPISLSAFAMEHHSDNGSIIADLFLGSGSTLIACEQTNRTCFGMEIDPRYIDVIRRRYWKFINNGDETGWEEKTPAIIDL